LEKFTEWWEKRDVVLYFDVPKELEQFVPTLPWYRLNLISSTVNRILVLHAKNIHKRYMGLRAL
jgi:hypothetical protein